MKRHISGLVDALVLAIIAGLILLGGWSWAQATRLEKAYTPTNLIRKSGAGYFDFIRLRVIANSDDPSDQEAKLAVRDAVMRALGPRVANANHPDEAYKIIEDSLSEIEELATRCLRERGHDYGATVKLATSFAEAKLYPLLDGKELLLPEGNYRTLLLVLGKGEGQNWWCVMYPPLCYLDLVQRICLRGQGDQAAAGSLQNLQPNKASGQLSPVEMRQILIDELETREIPTELRSLIVDAVKSGLAKLSEYLASCLRSLASGHEPGAQGRQ